MLRFWPACFGDSQPADGAGWHDGGVLLTLSGHDPVDVVPVGSLYTWTKQAPKSATLCRV